MPRPPVPKAVVAAVAALLALHSVLLAWGAWRHSPTWNEPAHLAAGISHWHFRSFDLYRVNPPLVRGVATAPLMLAGPGVDWSLFREHPTARTEMSLGRHFMAANGRRALWLTTIARWTCLPFSLLGGLICFVWARRLYGNLAGLTALTLWCFSPNMIAHAQLVTSDVPATTMGLAAAWMFRLWLKTPNWHRAFGAGVVLGLAQLTKTTWIVLYVIWPAVWFVDAVTQRRGNSSGWSRAPQRQLLAIVLTSVYVTNVGYLFEDSFSRLDELPFVSRMPTVTDSHGATVNRFRDTWLAGLPVPFPKNYVLGIDLQKHDFERGMWSYLRGEWRIGGWWHYYIYGLIVKVPLGTWIVVLVALLTNSSSGRSQRTVYDELLLLGIPLTILVLVSLQTGINHHLRYLLPAFPFVFVRVAAAAQTFADRASKLRLVFAGGLITSCVSSLLVYPHSLSYFNALVGPANGHKHLGHSNTDWGQDLIYLRDWMDRHPQTRPVFVALETMYEPALVGIDGHRFSSLPNVVSDPASISGHVDPVAGWYAISVDLLNGRTASHAWLRDYELVTTIGYTIRVYRVPDG